MKRKMALLSSELSHFSTNSITVSLIGAYTILFSTNVATYYFIDLLLVCFRLKPLLSQFNSIVIQNIQ